MLNPSWKAFADELERTGAQPRTNPDGDVGLLWTLFVSEVADLRGLFLSSQVDLQGVDFSNFIVPPCEVCSEEGRDETVVRMTQSHLLWPTIQSIPI